MKNKAPLALIELTIMLLVLSAAAALCLKGFAWANTRWEENVRRDMALIEVQNAAEVLRHCGGDLEAAVQNYGGELYQGQWIIQDAGGQGVVLRITPEKSDIPNLGTARLEAVYAQTTMIQLQVCWQEVDHGE